MNKSSEFFRPLIILGLVLFASIAAASELPAVLIYLITIKLIYAVIISIAINEWKNKDEILIESRKEKTWASYNYFGAVEKNNSMINLYFNNKKTMRSNYFKLLVPKAVVILSLLLLSVESLYQSLPNNKDLFFYSFGYISVIYIAYKLFECIKSIQAINSDSWCIKEQQLDEKTYYSAYIKEPEETYSPYLSEVLK